MDYSTGKKDHLQSDMINKANTKEKVKRKQKYKGIVHTDQISFYAPFPLVSLLSGKTCNTGAAVEIDGVSFGICNSGAGISIND